MTSGTAILMLAAGASERMGRPKQLLPYKNTTLLGHCLSQAAGIEDTDLYLVLGAFHEEILPIVQNPAIRIIRHPDWKQGMGSSLAKGIREIGNYPSVLITLGDLPLLTRENFLLLTEAWKKGSKGMVATTYGVTTGVPVLFDGKYMEALSVLKGDQGARGLLHQHPDDLATVRSPVPYFDVDTPEAYQELTRK